MACCVPNAASRKRTAKSAELRLPNIFS
jgi:hypothetical protein